MNRPLPYSGKKGLCPCLCSEGSSKYSWGGDLCREAIGENGTGRLLLSKNSLDSHLCVALGLIESDSETICVPEKKLWVIFFCCCCCCCCLWILIWVGFVTFCAAVQSVFPGKLADK